MPDDVAVAATDSAASASAPAPAPAPDPAPSLPPGPDTSAPIGDPPPTAAEWQALETQLAVERAAGEAELAALHNDWGEAFDSRVALAKRLAGEVAGPEIVAAIDRAGLGDNPFLLRAVGEVAQRLYGARQVPVPGGGRDVERLRTRLDELHALQFHDDPRERESYRSPRVQGELARLYAALYGDEPVVGHDLRVA